MEGGKVALKSGDIEPVGAEFFEDFRGERGEILGGAAMGEDGAFARVLVEENDRATGILRGSGAVFMDDSLLTGEVANRESGGVGAEAGEEVGFIASASESDGGVDSAAAEAVMDLVDVDFGADFNGGKEGFFAKTTGDEVVAIDEINILEGGAERGDDRGFSEAEGGGFWRG